MDMIESVKEYVMNQIKKYKDNSPDHYDYWEEHIKYVYEESTCLAKKYNADLEIVSLGALLHDIALINQVGDRKDHHINGEKIARQVLECVYNHRSSKNAQSIEETCVADADILAHFDNIPMLFNSALVKNQISLNEINNWMKAAFEKDYQDLSDKTRKQFQEKYRQICDIVLKK